MSIIFQNFLFLEKFSIHGWTHIWIVCSIQLSVFMFRSVCVNEVWVYHVLGWFLVSILISKFILHLQIYFIIVNLFPPRKDSPVGWVVYLGLCLHYNLWISWIGLGPFNLFFKINQTLNEPKVFIYFISAWRILIQPVTCSLKGISFEQQHQQFLWWHVQSLLTHYYNNIPAGISSCPNPTLSLYIFASIHQYSPTPCNWLPCCLWRKF